MIVNPTLIVEVFRPQTKAIRGRKWAQYQSIASLQTYVLVAQDRARIEQYVRQPDDTWLLSTAAGLDKSIYLASIDCTLALSEVYEGLISTLRQAYIRLDTLPHARYTPSRAP